LSVLLAYFMKLLLLCLLFFGAPLHDIQVAFFKIHQENNQVHVDFVFEKEDILQTFNKGTSKFSEERLQSYLQDHFTLMINKEMRSLEYGEVKQRNKHIFLRASLAKPIQSIESFEINNTCLLNIEDHSNIIEIRFHEQERDFLMNTDRTTIKVNY